MSLRARLIFGLVALAAMGMLLLAAITYAEQRSFLLERVDQQALAALPAVAYALDSRDVGGPRFGGPGHLRGRRGVDPSQVSLPPGTYGQRRSTDGEVLGSVVLTYGQDPPPAPDLPEQVEPGRLFTVGAQDDADLRYRVAAQVSPAGDGITLAALPLTELDATLDRLLVVETLVIAAVLLALTALSWLLVRVGLMPLDRIADTAGAIAGGDLSRRVTPADRRTEVGRLGLALNAMLERLEQAFAEREASQERLRRFIADASHELRTPLASIRGYAELFRMGAITTPEETENAMRRIEGEAARMGVLVEDLLALARLDQVRDAEPEQVDVTALADDMVQDARAMAPDRAVSLVAEPSAVVLGDGNQLRQVLGNLLRNALAHTPAGTPIDVRVSAGAGIVTVEVRDHGPGLPTADPEVLFERFWRAERGRERGAGGAGLGLAIVAGIVDAHGGRVRAESVEDGGSRFVVELPAVRRPEQAADEAQTDARGAHRRGD